MISGGLSSSLEAERSPEKEEVLFVCCQTCHSGNVMDSK